MLRHETDTELRDISFKKKGAFHNFTNSIYHQSSPFNHQYNCCMLSVLQGLQLLYSLWSSKKIECQEERHVLLLVQKHQFASTRQLLSWASHSGSWTCIARYGQPNFQKRQLEFPATSTEADLKVGHCTARLHWGQERRDWATGNWKRSCFTDESAFEISKPNRSLKVRRYPGEQYNDNCLVPSFKSDRTSASIWGVILIAWHDSYRPLNLFMR